MLAVTPSGDGRTTGIVSVFITASLFLRLFLVLLSYSLVTALFYVNTYDYILTS